MESLVRPRTASPNSPPIKHARSLSPRSVMLEYECLDEDAQELQHLQQPLQENLDYDYFFRDFSADAGLNNTGLRPVSQSTDISSPRINKRKLASTDLPPRSVMNLRHRKVSNETMEWLGSFNSTNQKLDADDNEKTFSRQLPPIVVSPIARKEEERFSTRTFREPVEELWLGPMFESSQTVLNAIVSLPTSVTHLDLDLRNALHILPQAMPLLFEKRHLKSLSLRVFGDAGVVELAKWLNQNPNLEHLDLRGNRIGSMGVRTMIDAIMVSESSHDAIDKKPLRSRLTHLNLSCNCILHGDKIGDMLAVNSTLETLDLSFNWLGNEEVQDIFFGLRKNTSLREINLYGCHRISHTGMKVILRCLQNHNTSLHKVGLQAFDEKGRRLIEKINYWLKLNRAGRYLIKSNSALLSTSSKQDNKTNETEPVPISLWPRVLMKSNKDPDSIFHLVREGFGQKIISYR